MSNDLISRKALSEEIKSLRVSITGSGNDYMLLEEYKKTVLRCIEEAPSAYDTDAAKRKLENEYKDAKEAYEEYDEKQLYGEMIAYKDAIKILENEGNKND